MKTGYRRIRHLAIALTVLLSTMFSMSASAALVIGSGDNISQGNYPTRRGTILVTSDYMYGLIPTGHAAMVWDEDHVVEAVGSGVLMGKNAWTQDRREFYGLTVNCTSIDQDRTAAEWAKSQLGKPYNYNYFNKTTREKFYCSQLVWAAFKDTCGVDLSKVYWSPLSWSTAVHPMELVKSNKTDTIYYFKKK